MLDDDVCPNCRCGVCQCLEDAPITCPDCGHTAWSIEWWCPECGCWKEHGSLPDAPPTRPSDSAQTEETATEAMEMLDDAPAAAEPMRIGEKSWVSSDLMAALNDHADHLQRLDSDVRFIRDQMAFGSKVTQIQQQSGKLETQLRNIVAGRTLNPDDLDHDTHAEKHREIQRQIDKLDTAITEVDKRRGNVTSSLQEQIDTAKQATIDVHIAAEKQIDTISAGMDRQVHTNDRVEARIFEVQQQIDTLQQTINVHYPDCLAEISERMDVHRQRLNEAYDAIEKLEQRLSPEKIDHINQAGDATPPSPTEEE